MRDFCARALSCRHSNLLQYVSLFIPWRVRAWAYLLCVFHGVSWFPCFVVWPFAFWGSLPLVAFTHLDLACLMASSSYACGGCYRACPLVGGGAAVLSFPSCVAHLGFLSSCGSVAHRTTYLFRRRHVHVAPTLCCLVVLFFILVLGRAQVPYSYCMHFAKCFGVGNVQLSRLGGSCVRCFSVSVLPFSTSPNSGAKFCGGFLRSENTILPFSSAGCASVSWFFHFSLLRSRTTCSKKRETEKRPPPKSQCRS